MAEKIDSIPDMENTRTAEAGGTLLADSGEAFTELSAAQWRRRFAVAEGKELSDYGELNTLGIGGMGVVFEAEDPALKRKIALKLLRPQYRSKEASIERFIREARITAQIDHPNVVSVHRFGFFEGAGVYFTMKRVQGRTLKRVLEKLANGDKDLTALHPLRHLVQNFIAVCNGIAAAHERGFLHCDLKPANVMVGKFGQVFVMDWGIAREIADPVPELPENTPHPLEGTPVFMAPELISGELAAPDVQSDLYSLGAILWCILTKREAPFDPAEPSETLLPKIAAGAFPRPSRCVPKGEKVPAELEAIVLKAMARDRKERYASVSELLTDLYCYMDGYPVAAYSPNIFYRAAKLIRRHPIVPLTLLAALLTAGIFAGTLRVIEYFNNRTRFAVAYADFARSVDGLQQTARRLQRLRDSGNKVPEAVFKERKQRQLLALHNVSADFFDALNTISRFSAAEQRRFLLSGGSETFRKLLLLQLEFESEELAISTVKRFQRLYPALFRLAMEKTSPLERLIARIRSGTGILRIEGKPVWQCTVFRAEEKVLAAGTDSTSAELPVGGYQVRFTRKNGTVVTRNVRVPLGRTTVCFAPRAEEKNKLTEKKR